MPNRRPEEYLALAQEAESAAERLEGVEGMVARDCWLAIAREYRQLAACKLEQMRGGRSNDNQV